MIVITSKVFSFTRVARECIGVAVFVLCIGLASGAAAESKPQHYESAAPASVKEAQTVLAESVKTISAAFSARDFEGVHKTSYKAEKAAAVLAEAPAADPGLSERLAHTIEVVHQASEIPSEAILAVAVPALEEVAKEVLAAPKPTN